MEFFIATLKVVCCQVNATLFKSMRWVIHNDMKRYNICLIKRSSVQLWQNRCAGIRNGILYVVETSWPCSLANTGNNAVILASLHPIVHLYTVVRNLAIVSQRPQHCLCTCLIKDQFMSLHSLWIFHAACYWIARSPKHSVYKGVEMLVSPRLYIHRY